METSNGAGIHPINAIRKITPLESVGKTCLISTGLLKFKPAKIKDNMVLIVNAIIKYLINLSRVLYFPIKSKKNESSSIISVQISTEIISPKIEFARPAVTIVTAVCIVNMVPSVMRKKKTGNVVCSFL